MEDDNGNAIETSIEYIQKHDLDDVTTYWFGTKNGRPGCVNITINYKPNIKYTREYLKRFFSRKDYVGPLRYDEENEIVIDQSNDLVFIPLTNADKIIVYYSIVEFYADLPKLVGNFSYVDSHKGKVYAYQRESYKSLSSLTFGRRAHRGGWEKICYDEELQDEIGDAVMEDETIEDDILAECDEEEEEEFNEDEYLEKTYNISKTINAELKELTQTKTRKIVQKGEETWIYGEGIPHLKEGKMGYFYRDILTGETYKKTPKRVLDHINSDSLDNRSSNIREIPCGFNSANRVKKAGCSSRYVGVSWHYKTRNWIGTIRHEHICYTKGFKREEDAAKFRDLYAVYLYRFPMVDNNTLCDDEIKAILDHGLDAIPEMFICNKHIKRDLPVGIRKHGERYMANKSYRGTFFSKYCDTLEQAKEALQEFCNKVNDIKEQEKLQWQRENMHELKGEFGYIYTTNRLKEITDKYKVTRRVWLKYAHLSWHKVSGYAYTSIKGASHSLHYLIYKLDHPDYECCIHGSIDHTQRDKNDCTEIHLEAVSNSHQKQNRDMPKLVNIPFQGVFLARNKYYAVLKKKKDEEDDESKKDLDAEHTEKDFHIGPLRIYMEDAAKDYNDFVLQYYKRGKLNEISNTKTTANSIYNRKYLTVDKIKNIKTTVEMRSIFFINKEWSRRAAISNSKYIYKEALDKYREIAVRLKEEDDKGYVSHEPYHRSNLYMEFIEEINTIDEVERILQYNPDWRFELDGTPISTAQHVPKGKIEHFKTLFREYMKVELQEREDFFQETGIVLKRLPFVSKYPDISHETVDINIIERMTQIGPLNKLFRVKKQWYRKKGDNLKEVKIGKITKWKELAIQYLRKEIQMRKAGIKMIPGCVCLIDEINGNEVPEVDVNSVDEMNLKQLKKVFGERPWWYRGKTACWLMEVEYIDDYKNHLKENILREKIMRKNGILLNKPVIVQMSDEELLLMNLNQEIINELDCTEMKRVIGINYLYGKGSPFDNEGINLNTLPHYKKLLVEKYLSVFGPDVDLSNRIIARERRVRERGLIVRKNSEDLSDHELKLENLSEEFIETIHQVGIMMRIIRLNKLGGRGSPFKLTRSKNHPGLKMSTLASYIDILIDMYFTNKNPPQVPALPPVTYQTPADNVRKMRMNVVGSI